MYHSLFYLSFCFVVIPFYTRYKPFFEFLSILEHDLTYSHRVNLIAIFRDEFWLIVRFLDNYG